jgi:hypothetical protein
VLFFSEIPPLQRFQICGIRTSDKILTYVLALQLLFSQGSRSLNAGVAGIVGGILWSTQTRLFSFLKIRFPAALQRLITTSGSRPLRHPRVLSASGPAMAASMGVPQQQPQQQQQPNLQPLNPNHLPPVLFPLNPGPPPAELVNQLVAMGFDEVTATAALVQTHNNVDLAVNLLISS